MLQYVQKKCNRCVLALVRQYLHIVFCILVTFSPFSVLDEGKPKGSSFCNFLNFVTQSVHHFLSTTRSILATEAQWMMGKHGLMGNVVPTLLCCIQTLLSR